jgi:hypothetical protein
MLKRSFCILLLLFISSDLHAIGDDAGTSGIKVLKIGVGARQSAMGDTVAVLPDVNSVFANPATLINVKTPKISLTHNQWIADISQQTISAVYPKESYSLGIGLLYLHMDELTGYDIDSVGAPVKISDFTSYDIAGVLSYTRNILGVSLGTNLKLFQEKIEDEQAAGYALDFGVYKEFNNNLRIGVVAQNIGPDVKFIDEDTPLPANYKLGLGYKIPILPLLLALDVDKPIDNDLEEQLGAEYILANILSLRGGYKFGNDYREGVSFGAGVTISKWTLDYAFIPYGKAEDVHKVSLVVRIGEKSN